ncbi:transposase [Micromonospora chersina]|uniref:transposase n=1 Tax=Micromonospora chersina TaxID=47854 RepID=UPI0037222161
MVAVAWAAELDRLHARSGGRFRRGEPRARVRQYPCGLPPGWSARTVGPSRSVRGEVSADGTQRLLRWADWDVEAVRHDVRDYLIDHLGDPHGVLVFDDTGLLRQACGSRGCPQYSGTAGRVENCQVGVGAGLPLKRGARADRSAVVPTREKDRRRGAGRVGYADVAYG